MPNKLKPYSFSKLSLKDQATVKKVAARDGAIPIYEVGSVLYPLNEFIDFDWPTGAKVVHGASKSTPIAKLTDHAKQELANHKEQ